MCDPCAPVIGTVSRVMVYDQRPGPYNITATSTCVYYWEDEYDLYCLIIHENATRAHNRHSLCITQTIK